ncbi:Catalase [Pseudocercospora fuligena]|uniref:Catalase n=1 Tax=Pseudocercospora fuligena TaxID=685502 RepID=A0A8H6RM33_9PEZI|nr:Catalase [Pseudocercospora fuligena]
MKFLLLSLFASPLLAQGPIQRSHLKQVTKAQKVAYNADLFQGTDLKQKDSSLNNSDLWYTERNGKKYFQPLGAQRAGEKGPLLLQDVHLVDTLATFNRERIPERIVHARGAGAHGFFEATTDFAENLSAADVFKKGTRTSITMRFSTVGGARGSADEARDPRGFAIKFRTKQGILDWVFNNTPVFFIRDPVKFPRFIHTQKTDPATNVRDWNTFWSWPAQFPEALLQFLRLFSDLGTPYGFRHMDGWSGHTYRLVKDDGSWVYCRVYVSTDQGVKNFTAAEAAKVAGDNDAWATKDLYDAIESGNYPSWTVGIATKTPKEAEEYRYDILDLTKDWPDAEYHEVGRLTLTQNPENYFNEIEQSHFSPANLVPGWEPSNDPVLQSRLFAYNDAGRYRIGVNAEDLPVNCPFSSVANFDRDGHLAGTNGGQGSRKNFPAEYIDMINIIDRPGTEIDDEIPGTHTVHWQSQIDENIDYEQPKMFYEGFSQTDKDHLYSNIAGTLVNVDNQEVITKLFEQFEKVSPALLEGVKKAYEEAQASKS